jgi:hypothetical protein
MELVSAVVIVATLSLPIQPAVPIAVSAAPRLVITSLPAFTTAQPYRAQFVRHRRPSGARAGMIALAAIGGFFAGGYLGSKLEPDCRCDDPGLMGFVIGAPVGAIASAIVVAQATR